MAIVDANRWVVSANGALQRLLSRAEEEIVGRSIDESLPPADQRTIADRWRAMLARGEGHGVQKLVVDRDVHTTLHPENHRRDKRSGAEQLDHDEQGERETAGRRFAVTVLGLGLGLGLHLVSVQQVVATLGVTRVT
jgi:PAS domain-containing protein